ncbi:MAG: hypothetical protein WAL31_03605 [Gaiellaceae bacterium]
MSEPERRHVRPLRSGESYDEAVWLAQVPNVPLAELWCQRLRQNGIEAFYKATGPVRRRLGGNRSAESFVPG